METVISAQGGRHTVRSNRYRSRIRWISAAFAAALLVSACGGSSSATSSNLSDDMKGTITVAYSTTYVFDSDDQSVIWWNKVKSEFEAAYPNAKLNLQGFNGTDVDLELRLDRKSTRLNSSHSQISYAVFCLKKKNK